MGNSEIDLGAILVWAQGTVGARIFPRGGRENLGRNYFRFIVKCREYPGRETDLVWCPADDESTADNM